MVLMEKAVAEFPSQYSCDKRVLGEKSMMFVRPDWNTHSWKAIENSFEFHTFILREMKKKSRIKDGELNVRIAFGHAKRNDTLVESAFFDEENSTALEHSQKSELRNSPAPKVCAKSIRETGWEYTDLVGKQVNRFYYNPDSFLHYGFLEEHGKTFAMLLLQAVQKEMGDTSSQLLSILKSDEAIFSENECRRHFLDIYMSRSIYKNNTQGLEPKKGKYPPTDEENTTMQVPPSCHEWLRAEKAKNVGNPYLAPVRGGPESFLHLASGTVSPVPPAPLHAHFAHTRVRIPSVTFEYGPVSITVLVQGTGVEMDTTMHDLMMFTDDDLGDEIGWDRDEDKYRYHLQKSTKGAKPFAFSSNSWKRLTVNDLISLEDVEIPLFVTITKM